MNEILWPAWPAFVASLKDGSNPSGLANLRLMLNLHPQGGTDACQKNWPAFAAELNYTSATLIPCTFGKQAIAAASFSAFMDADVLAPVDGWWTDFDYVSLLKHSPNQALPSDPHAPARPNPYPAQDGDCFDAPTASTPSSFPGIAWSNEVFGQHQRFARDRRPLVLSRSGGLGAHRNPVSFSGDANQHQDILRWELENTARAANVLHSTWSHDIARRLEPAVLRAGDVVKRPERAAGRRRAEGATRARVRDNNGAGVTRQRKSRQADALAEGRRAERARRIPRRRP